MNIAIVIISIIILATYCLTIIVFAIAFASKKIDNPTPVTKQEFISIIIACRNEENNIKQLLDSLLQQTYKGDYEILLIDDHSEDKTIDFAADYKDDRIKIINLPAKKHGKKAALRFGVNYAKGDILLFTDADCVIPSQWIELMANGLLSYNVDMLCGPVVFDDSASIFSSFFKLEFMSMTGSGASGFFIEQPFMCNGANYAIKKDIFTNNINNLNEKYSSGDDVFLLHHTAKNGKVKFIKNNNTTVITQAPENLRAFFEQRIRWASKTSGYKKTFAIFTTTILALTSLSLVLLAVLSLFLPAIWEVLLIAFIAKIIVDTFFMIPVCKFYGQIYLAALTPILQIFYPIYVVTTAILSLFYKPHWKGRRIS
ncbi:MAG: glycosyltransferase [Bacteroidales bacterium]|nr:glycosyltransferase [Bacteroidales bacterium]